MGGALEKVASNRTVAFAQTESKPALGTCVSAASYWMPNWVRPESAWIEHAPFAFWLVEALRPKTIVELGTYSGYSYAAFCQAVLACNLDCRCYGIDHWRGDEQTGFYGEEIFAAIRQHNDLLYHSFSQLVRSDFATTAAYFDDGSIDLLHLDGNHAYESVRSDYMVWRPKMSKSGVILFHDTAVVERNFGVSRLWQELCEDHANFQFLHGHGLGILAVGDAFPEPVEALFRLNSDTAAIHHLRVAYSRLGSSISDRLARQRFDKVERRLGREAYLTTLIAQQASRHQEQIAQLEGKIAQLGSQHRTQIEALQTAYDAMLHSTSWRWTKPLRVAMSIPRRLHRSLFAR